MDITVIAYVDDLLIFTKKDIQKHIRDVNAVFSRLAQSDFRTALKKCKFHKKEVEFLGFIISTRGFKVNPKKTKLI